jgi:hypothetical protein
MKNVVDLNDLAKRLKKPYKIGINLCLFFILGSLGMSLFYIKGGESFIFLAIAFLALFLSLWFRKRLKYIEDKIYLWGTEDAWNYFRGKKK